MVRPAGVLVDLDGTLVDTNYLHTLAWSRAFRDAGECVAMSVLHHLIGTGSDQLVQRALGHDCPAATEARKVRYRELMGEARVLPCAVERLREWHDAGLTVVLASSSPRDELEAMLGLLAAGDAIDAVTSADDVDRSKPHPDVFDAALEAGSIDAARAVVVGDSVWDVEAAVRADLAVVAVESGGVCAADLRAAGAADVFHDVSRISAAALRRYIGDDGWHLTGARQAAENRALDPPA
jgi:HAD superfamily hydrolase (TIGR01509 family)